MSDYVHTGRSSKPFIDHTTIESRLMFGVCYLLFLVRAVVTRLMPWRKAAVFGRSRKRESIFKEASRAAGVSVASSFMGL
jgi:hypothetical protein